MRTPLGVQYLPQASTFAVYAEAEAVRLRLVHAGSRVARAHPMRAVRGEAGVWAITLEGDWRGWAYSYEIEREGRTLADIVDPWAKLVREGRGYVVHETTPVPPGPELHPADAMIYELHLRDFTRDPSSGVRADWRGRYLGLAQTGTRLEGSSYSTGLDHILELGVNVVQLMPVHSFALPYHPEYEWGYMPNDYNAPHAGYAAGVDLEAPIREFKQLVSTLHKQGLCVTLDVVYNHTAEKWPSRLRSFMALAPRQYFRWKPDGAPSDGSNCGNEFRSESQQGRRFIVESCKYWATEFGIDGFRFDLMGLIDVETMEQVVREVRAIKPTMLVYGEPWAGGPTIIEVNGKGKQRGKGWGAFNDDFRDGFRGEVFKPKDPGFLAAGKHADRCKGAILGGVAAWTDSPSECVNYIECHDNHTLADRIALTTPPETRVGYRQRMEMNLMGAVALFTSAGVPFIHSGQEFGRSKDGEDNTYNLGDQINNIRWHDKADRHAIFTFYRAMIRLRREHPMFRLRTKEEVLQAVKFLDNGLGLKMPEGTLAWQATDVGGTDAWAAAVIALNGAHEARTIPLPEGLWRVAAIDGRIEHGKPEAAGTLELPPHWSAVLYRAR